MRARLFSTLAGFVVGVWLLVPPWLQARTFICGDSDTACLLQSIRISNTNGQYNLIWLTGSTYALPAADVTGPGLPVVTSNMAIIGATEQTTIIERASDAPPFPLLHNTGTLALYRLTLRGGSSTHGGGIRNEGALTLVNVTVADNHAFNVGGGVWNTGSLTAWYTTLMDNSALWAAGLYSGGARALLWLVQSSVVHNQGNLIGGVEIAGGTAVFWGATIANNFAQGIAGLANGSSVSGIPGGTVYLVGSSVLENAADVPGPAGIGNNGVMWIQNSTVSSNWAVSQRGSGSGIHQQGGTLIVQGSTVAHNITGREGGAGLKQTGGTAYVQNSILADNQVNNGPFPIPTPDNPDCAGALRSLGNNVFGTVGQCQVALQATDRVGSPGLGPLVDAGKPGQAYHPLMATSAARNTCNMAGSSLVDQLWRLRGGQCDVGAVEYRQELEVVSQVAE